MSGWRLPQGGRIDRRRPVEFRWSGRTYSGFAGDTLASALLANGVSIVGRSFKYHRPRGLLAAGLEEPNAIVQLETGAATVPNLKATHVELYDGLVAASVNAWPSAEFDLMAVNGWIKRFIPAAFYYKTFTWPHWRWFEPAIRRAAGLGVAPRGPDPDRYGHRYAHVDLIVFGAGAAGISAALAAAEGGARVMLVETEPVLGGGLLSSREAIAGMEAAEWLARAQTALATAGVQLLTRTTAFGYYDHDLVALCERLTDHMPLPQRAGPRQRLWKVRAARVMLATGAIERPLAFVNNDLPGVMLASAAQTYAVRFGAAVGRRIVLTTTNDSAYEVAFALHDLGVTIAAIVDSRDAPGAAARAGATERGLSLVSGAVPIRALGRRCVTGVAVGAVAAGVATATIACDALLVSGGWNPAVHLHSQAGGRLAFDNGAQAFLPVGSAQNAVSVGAAAGVFDLAEAIAGARMVATGALLRAPRFEALGPMLAFADGDASAHKVWLDFQNDVTVGDIQLAARENFRSVEHVKRYTTLGMASDQGKTSNVVGIRVLAGLLGKAPDAIGTTRFRPPYDPVTIGALAGIAVGDDLMPVQHSAAHSAHVALGAAMEDYGGWRRAAFYRRAGENEAHAVAREVRAVRGAVGLFDASPLGKIELVGPDAAIFLDRMYANLVCSLKPGRCRYGLMLSEHGIVHDDGVFARLAEDRFLVGTTSGHAVAIADRFDEWLQCEWPDMRVLTENVTTGWATINVAGPKARAVLARVGTDIDLEAQIFPHMAYREGRVGGVPARIQRVSFTGELSFEVSVPWGYGAALWDAFMAAGADDDITPFGIEAMMAMRIEKGFLHIGSDSDGTTMPQDVGFGAAIAKKPGDFVGRRSTMTLEGMRPDRRQLVGIAATDDGGAFTTGAHVLSHGARSPCRSDGWVTSSVWSPTLDRPLAMGLVRSGTTRLGEQIIVWHDGKARPGTLVDPRAYDREGKRLDV